MVTIFQYLDYRKFLADILKEKGAVNKSFSQRAILRKMGVSSSGYLANVISGKSSLSIDGAVKLSEILKLNKSETAYFKKLLYFGKAKSIEEKKDFFSQLLASKKRDLSYLDKEQLSLFSEWFIVPIRELMQYYDFRDDYAALARMLNPPIGVKDAEKAVLTLEKLGLIQKNESGIYRPVNTAISTGDEVHSFFVTNFQFKMIDLAKLAIERTKPDDRDISGLTLSISKEKFLLIKEEIQEFRKKILQIAIDDPSPEQVIRCNFQVFPLTKPKVK